MAKTIEEILGTIQDAGDKTLLQSALSDAQAKAARLSGLEQELSGKELVSKEIVDGWRDFDRNKKPVLEKELKEVAQLREEIARLKPEAERAAILAKQIEEGQAVDPKDIVKMAGEQLASKFVSVDKIQEIVNQAVTEAKRQVDYGSLPAGLKLLEVSDRARREYGLDIPVETMAEASSRYGSVDKAFEALTLDARTKKSEADRAAAEAKYKADVAAAEKAGYEKGLRDVETRTYNPEEGGPAGVIPMVSAKEEEKGVDPTSYNPSDGRIAREAAEKLRKQEADGLWGRPVM